MKIGHGSIILNSVNWIKDDILFEGKVNVSNIEALHLAKKYNARIPNKEDYLRLSQLPHKFIQETNEWIFAETDIDLQNGINVLRFNLNGWEYSMSTDENPNTGVYWSDLQNIEDLRAGYIFFNKDKVKPHDSISPEFFLFSLKLIKI